MALHRAKLGVSLFRHPCRKPISPGKGLSVGLPPSPSKDACSQSHTVAVQGRIMTATQSRCTMQRHQRLTTRIGATPQTPFYKI